MALIKKYLRHFFPFLLLALAVILCSSSRQGSKQTERKSTDWQILFDGKTLNGWKGYNSDTLPANWSVTDGLLVADGSGGDIITIDEFEDFELSLEWRISKGGNSGIFYHVKEGPYDKIWVTGIEMQVMDNENNPLGAIPKRSAGSVYDLYAPSQDFSLPAGSWNEARVIVRDSVVTYFLNGEQILKFRLWDAKWYSDRENSIHYKERKPDWGEFSEGHIGLQDEGFPVAFRAIRIRSFAKRSSSCTSAGSG